MGAVTNHTYLFTRNISRWMSHRISVSRNTIWEILEVLVNLGVPKGASLLISKFGQRGDNICQYVISAFFHSGSFASC